MTDQEGGVGAWLNQEQTLLAWPCCHGGRRGTAHPPVPSPPVSLPERGGGGRYQAKIQWSVGHACPPVRSLPFSRKLTV